MAGITDRVEEFLEVWNKRKSGEPPSPDLTVSCSACGAVITGDEEIELVNMEMSVRGAEGVSTEIPTEPPQEHAVARHRRRQKAVEEI